MRPDGRSEYLRRGSLLGYSSGELDVGPWCDRKEKLSPGLPWRTIVSKVLGFVMIRYIRHSWFFPCDASSPFPVVGPLAWFRTLSMQYLSDGWEPRYPLGSPDPRLLRLERLPCLRTARTPAPGGGPSWIIIAPGRLVFDLTV